MVNFQKKVFCIMAVFAIALSSQAGESENLLKNGSLNMEPGKSAPIGWIGDKLPKQLVKEGLLAILQQAVKVEVKEANKQHGFIYQYISPKNGFKQPAVVLQGYLRSKVKGGAFLQMKLFKGKKQLKIVNVFCTLAGDWELVKQTFPLEGADKVQVLCRYLRSEKYIDNIVEFADISLTTTDKPLVSDDFKNKKVKIVVLGDSTVQTFAPGFPLVGWGQLLQNYFKKDVGVRNHALSGCSTKTFIQQGLLEKALKDKADYAFIQFGHNDSHKKTNPEATDAKTDYKDYLKQYVETFKKNGTKVIFVTPMRRMTFRKDGTLSDNLQPYADAMKEVAAEKECLAIDLHESSNKLFLKLGAEKCKEFSGREKDRSHFSSKGADAMAKLIIKDLSESDSLLVKYIKK